jgi:hypothetical protein
MALSFFALKRGNLSFALVASATILRDVALVSLIFFFLWRNGEPVSRVGWAFRDKNSLCGGKSIAVRAWCVKKERAQDAVVRNEPLRRGLEAGGGVGQAEVPSHCKDYASYYTSCVM